MVAKHFIDMHNAKPVIYYFSDSDIHCYSMPILNARQTSAILSWYVRA